MNNKPTMSRTVLVLAFTAALACTSVFASQAGKEYNETNKELDATYQKVLAIITDPEGKRLFVEAQSSWARFRDSNLAFHARYFPGSKGGLFVGTEMNQERTKELKALLSPEANEEHKPHE